MNKLLLNVLKIVLAVMLLTMTVLSHLTAIAEDGISHSESERFNVVLVIDGSGSLVGESRPTDPNGYRYRAAEIFLNTLETEGHNVGAIVFNGFNNGDFLYSTEGVHALNGREEKKALILEIEEVGAKGQTDIGRALECAVDWLVDIKNKNGLKSIVLLLTDGMTDLGSGGCTYEQNCRECINCESRDIGEKASFKAFDEKIEILGAFLNDGGKLDGLELFNIVRGSRNNYNDPETPNRNIRNDLNLISSLDNQYVEIHNSDDLANMALLFSLWLYGVNEVPPIIEGCFQDEILIPSKGITDLNININFGKEPNNIILTDPNGIDYHYGRYLKRCDGKSPCDSNSHLCDGSTIDNVDSLSNYLTTSTIDWHITITDKDILIPGPWKVSFLGEQGIKYVYNILLHNEVKANIKSTIDNNIIKYESWLSFEGNPIPESDYIAYNIPMLNIWANNENIITENEMKFSDSGHYYYELELNGQHYAKAVYRYGQNRKQPLESNILETILPSPIDPFINYVQDDNDIIINIKNDINFYGYNLYISDSRNDLLSVLNNENFLIENVLIFNNITVYETDIIMQCKYIMQVSELQSNFSSLFDSQIYLSVRAIDINGNELQSMYVNEMNISPPSINPFIRYEQNQDKITFYLVNDTKVDSYTLYISDNDYDFSNYGSDGEQGNTTGIVAFNNLEILPTDDISKVKFVITTSEIKKHFSDLYRIPLFFCIQPADLEYSNFRHINRMSITPVISLAELVLVCGVLLLSFSIILLCAPKRYTIWTEQKDNQHKHTRKGKKEFITGKLGSGIKLKQAPSVFDNKRIAELGVTFFKAYVVVKEIQGNNSDIVRVKPSNKRLEKNNKNMFKISYKGEEYDLSIWYESETDNKLKFTAFIACLSLGLILTLIGILIL